MSNNDTFTKWGCRIVFMGAAFSIGMVVGSNTSSEHYHTKNTIIPDTPAVTKLKSIQPETDLTTVGTEAIDKEAQRQLAIHQTVLKNG